MSGITVVLPSRGRPERCRQAVDALRATAIHPLTRIAVVVDEDDPTLPAYLSTWYHAPGPDVTVHTLAPADTGSLVAATNTVSMQLARWAPDTIIGNLGDDHLARTPGWDRAILNVLHEPGIAYGDDGLKGEALPTAPFISARIVLALGWYALPSCRHMYIDDAWKLLGQDIGRLHYLPDLVFEHMHPGAGKAESDDGYARADSSTEADRAAFNEWAMEYRKVDVAAVKRALA